MQPTRCHRALIKLTRVRHPYLQTRLVNDFCECFTTTKHAALKNVEVSFPRLWDGVRWPLVWDRADGLGHPQISETKGVTSVPAAASCGWCVCRGFTNSHEQNCECPDGPQSGSASLFLSRSNESAPKCNVHSTQDKQLPPPGGSGSNTWLFFSTGPASHQIQSQKSPAG